MFKNYILIALRKLSREKGYVLISILSLALGIAGFLLLGLYLRSELTYDEHHVNHDRIYRVNAFFQLQGSAEPDHFAVSQVGVGPLLVKDFPQLGEYVRLRRSTQNVLTFEEKQRQWDRIYLADPTVFDIFTHKIVYGDVKKAFHSPYSVAISESMAKYYFGDQNPIDKKLSSGAFNYAVTLVYADLPENTHLRYDALFPMALMDVFTPGFSSNYENTLWGVGIFTYLMVPPAFDAKDFDPIAARFVETYLAETAKRLKGRAEPRFQKLTDIHFGEKLSGDLLIGNIFYVYGFAAVALFILIVACINYVNLATARAMKRAKEVGMRKVLGASRSQLIAQFLGESTTFTAIALVVALVIIYLALTLTPLGTLMGKEKLVAELLNPGVIVGVFGLALLVAIVSGLYPAFYLSSISPLAALTHVRRSWKTGFSLRQVLVFAQLMISIGVIACTMLMIDQIRYIHEKPLGFDKENRLVVTLRGYDVVKNFKTIRGELRNTPNVQDVTAISVVPGTGHAINLIQVETNDGVFEATGTDRIQVGLNFIQAMNIEVIEGRPFSEDLATDVRQSAIVNESFVKKMGWEKPLGKRFKTGPQSTAQVVGVVKDFHYASLHNEMGALMIHPMSEQLGPVPENQKSLTTLSFVVVMSGASVPQTLRDIEAVITKFDPKLNFEPVFLDDKLNELYKTESNLMKLTGVFAAVCIFISVMGIFGLAAFTTEQRTKEIGIRKVLGASDSQIVAMLSRPLLWLVVIAAIPASYVGYRAIDAWMQRFAYHTEISSLTFVLSTVLVCFIALATVVTQSLRTTSSNPVDALRYE